MSQQQILKFNIRQDGTVTEEVIGTVGKECEQLTLQIEENLGTVTRKEYKPEFYQQLQVDEEVEEWSHDSECA
tara:strand:- start:3247 stop:3465 length:219 start_codon:yes stop_codon:yes gene_type:complete